MSNNEGIPPKFSSIFSLISHGFINIYEYYNKIICILDHLVNMLCLSIYLKPSLVCVLALV